VEVEKDFVQQCDFLFAVGARVIGAAEQGNSIQGKPLPIFDAKPRFTNEEWKRLTEGLNHLGTIAKKKGMQLVYHHHMGTGVQTTEEIDRLMERTDPELVGLLYDTGHLVFSGEDHLAVLHKYLKRIKHVHLKNVRFEVMEKAEKEKWSFLQAVRKWSLYGTGGRRFRLCTGIRCTKERRLQGLVGRGGRARPCKGQSTRICIDSRKYIKDKRVYDTHLNM